jgi:magnesium chelatase family protein
MAPADLRKEGSAYDLTLTIGILVAQQITAVDIDKYIIMGSSMGVYNPFVEPYLLLSKRRKRDLKAFFPKQNVKEAAIVAGLDVWSRECTRGN